VALKGTSHLWIADADGVLHWSGDTRALSGKTIDWGNRSEATLDQLKAMRRGDPWLSAGLLKDGDPIYFVKWETEWAQPQLLRIQSIADVELFGIDGSNYGSYVLDRAAWEQKYGITAASLTKGTLASAAGSTASTGSTSTGSAGTTAAPSGSQRGALAKSISDQEKAAFLESALGWQSKRVIKWQGPVRVQIIRSSFDVHGPMVDGVVNELSELIKAVPISRVQSGGNMLIEFVPLAAITQAFGEGVSGVAAPTALNPDGSIAQCRVVVAQDPEKFYGALADRLSPQQKTDLVAITLRHEMGHCMGLGHNSSPSSFMSYSFNGMNEYYTRGSRAARFPDFDRALLRTLYHSAVKAGMNEAALSELFAAS
jgi:hypothetical protein